MIDRQAIRQRWDADGSKRDERGRRLFAASEVRAAGWGGLAAVSDVTGLARSTIERGLKNLDAPPPAPGRIRRDGGGPRQLTERDPTLLADLERIVVNGEVHPRRALARDPLELGKFPNRTAPSWSSNSDIKLGAVPMRRIS